MQTEQQRMRDRVASVLWNERHKRRLSRRDAAAQAGVPFSSLRSWELATCNISFHGAAKLAAFYGITLDELAGEQK